MLIRFFTRHDFGKWRKWIWLPVSVVQGRFVHCEIEVDGVVLNADSKRGVELRVVHKYVPSRLVHVSHDRELYAEAVQGLLGLKYSWSGFFRLLLPKWGNDPRGMICSELVAHIIALTATDELYRIPFLVVPSYRWTPNALYQALDNLECMT